MMVTGPSINEDEIINCLLNNIESNKYYEFVVIRRERTRNMQLVYSNCYMTLSNFDSDGTLHSEIASALNSLQNNDELKKRLTDFVKYRDELKFKRTNFQIAIEEFLKLFKKSTTIIKRRCNSCP